VFLSGEFNKNLEELVMFLAQVAKCYPEEMSDYPQKLVEILKKHSTVIDAVSSCQCSCKILLPLSIVVYNAAKARDKNMEPFCVFLIQKYTLHNILQSAQLSFLRLITFGRTNLSPV
jgi:hypothetical protein